MRIFLLICALLALAGCGKKGNLYLPDSATPLPNAPQSTQPAQK
jgi:predicted small lipoprotein YifL